jgi:glyoxylase I family protein
MPQAFDDIYESLQAGGYHHFCLRVDSVDRTLAELRSRDVEVTGEPFEVEEVSSRLALVSDPWGNLIEISEDLR